MNRATAVRLFPPTLVFLFVGWATTLSTAQAKAPASTTPPRCDVTIPNGIQPPVKDFGGRTTYSATYTGPRDGRIPGSHGNGKLWTVLPLDGKLLIPTDVMSYHHGLWEKFWWWRGVRGPLTIRGRRLDARATPLQPQIPAGYGMTGFQASGISFPTEGCWEVTGTAGGSELTFVVLVRPER
jgi:hypothetical protein